MPHTQLMQQIARSQQQQVCSLLDIDEMTYCTMQYEAGQDYLHAYLSNDYWAIEELERSKLYWSWWKNHWIARDAQFLESNPHLLTVAERRSCFVEMNNPLNLICTITPGSMIMKTVFKSVKMYSL